MGTTEAMLGKGKKERRGRGKGAEACQREGGIDE